MKTACERLISSLHGLLLMDYGAELCDFNTDENAALPFNAKVSFFRLSSCYNAFVNTFHGESDPIFVNWQYATENKKAGALATKAARATSDLLYLGRENMVRAIYGHYKTAADAVYEAKYSISESLYTGKGGPA